eukprot:CAMPEP_0170489614 /NCGR_PEP_ID=MMETSP0208-20121228/7937_1 /TAXON_ID=197538 /ORGANISM="Strombidium inclinatum, Strain S3" /LENGTH=214 /DNA_ID=CAMNT_0010764603 /DNA_START=534 /DNA_END=1178 /DNA_ORIENTATION=-
MRSPTTSTHDALIHISNVFSQKEAVERVLGDIVQTLEDASEDKKSLALESLKELSNLVQGTLKAAWRSLEGDDFQRPAKRRRTSQIDWEGEFADFEEGINDEVDEEANLKRMKVQASGKVFDSVVESSREHDLSAICDDPFVLKIERGVQCNLDQDSTELSNEVADLKAENCRLRDQFKILRSLFEEEVSPHLMKLQAEVTKLTNENSASRRME